jgi:parvulin-like peptidyl-prolyl isomerase
MRKCSLALLALAVCASAQTLPINPPKEAVVAVVNGRTITLSEYKRMAEAQEGHMKALSQQNPKVFLEQYALYEAVLAAAEKAGLDKQSPFKERIAMQRRQILVSGLIDARHAAFTVSPEEVQAYFDKNKAMYQQAMVRVIFLSAVSETRNLADGTVTKALTPEEIKQRAEKAAQLAREGVDFAKVAKEYSDDPASADKGGEFPHPIRPNSNNVPPNIRGPVLKAKAGDIVGPITHETGYYIFEIQSNGPADLDQVKEDIVKEMKDASLKQWLDEFKKASSVTLENEALLTEAAKGK